MPRAGPSPRKPTQHFVTTTGEQTHCILRQGTVVWMSDGTAAARWEGQGAGNAMNGLTEAVRKKDPDHRSSRPVYRQSVPVITNLGPVFRPKLSDHPQKSAIHESVLALALAEGMMVRNVTARFTVIIEDSATKRVKRSQRTEASAPTRMPVISPLQI